MVWILAVILAVLPSFADAACTGASPTWSCPASTLNTDITTLQASGSFVRNDTVNVTGSGTVALGGTITLTKGIKLMGPGRDVLTFTRSSTFVDITPDATAISSENTIKVDGFTFDGGNTANFLVTITGADAANTKPFKNLVITNNRFKDPSQTGSTKIINQTGQVRGVIAGNIFDRPKQVLYCGGNDVLGDYTNSAYHPVTLGDADSLYFENNTIQWSTAGGGGNQDYEGWMECGQGGRLVARYNTWDFTNQSYTNQDNLWDVHGGQGAETGTMKVEYYGNKAVLKSHYSLMNLRGGKGITMNNVMTGSDGTPNSDAHVYPGGCDAERGVTQLQINNFLWWNNRINTSTTITLDANNDLGNSGCQPPVEGVDFWNENAACTSSACAAGVGKGTTAPTGTCTTGVGYWVASDSSPLDGTVSANRTIMQAGTLYRCTSTNVWGVFWQPYTYPHPLVSGTTSSPPRFSPALNLRVASAEVAP